LNSPAVHCLDGLDRILPVNPRRLELVAPSKSVEQSGSGFLPYAHGAVSLTIAMSPDRTNPRTRFSDVSLKQQKIDDFPNRGDGVLVLCEAHCPATDDSFGCERHLSSLANLGAIQAAALDNLLPAGLLQRGDQCIVAGRMASNKLVVENSTWSLSFLIEKL